ncbi:aspartate aminotransferase, cytoplasmic-like [Antedon mediterranea]|uniref:aspartate aminotransferase, cytoplasmic-like n=1 Tax=Antedon mediterranea TaxID=105859 RepID=UPI003AF9EA18
MLTAETFRDDDTQSTQCTIHSRKKGKKVMAKSVFSNVQAGLPIAVFQLTIDYKADTSPLKVNLGVGAYRTDDGVPWVLPVVRQVEEQMAADRSLDHEYLPISGLQDFTSGAVRMILGDDSPAIVQNRALGFQALSGTGAIRLGADFIHKHLNGNVAYVPVPTWPNHYGIFQKAVQYKEVRTYRYWRAESRDLDFEGMAEDIKAAPEGAVIILHACAHNPTGVDLTTDQWKKIAEIVQERKLLPFFDCAYIGFATGDVEKDSWAVRYFVSKGIEFFAAQSFSKSFGLYNERVGNLTVVMNNADYKNRIKSQMELIARAMWSNPPNHGARIVATVLNNPALYKQWQGHIKEMSSRVFSMREMLYQHLKSLGTPGTWNHIVDQIGMFTFTGLGPKQVQGLRNRHHIYCLSTGRINMCALTTKNVEHVAKAIHDVVTTITED